MDTFDVGAILGFLAIWKFIERVVDTRLAKRNNNSRKGNPGGVVDDVVLLNSLNNIDNTLDDLRRDVSVVVASLERIERRLDV